MCLSKDERCIARQIRSVEKGVVQSAESVLQSVLLHVIYAGIAGIRTEKKAVI